MKVQFKLEIENIEIEMNIKTPSEKSSLADENLLKGCAKLLTEFSEEMQFICKDVSYVRNN